MTFTATDMNQGFAGVMAICAPGHKIQWLDGFWGQA
jgi:hypothetical protein